MKSVVLTILLCFCSCGMSMAQGESGGADTVVADTTVVKEKTWIDKFLDYFNDANKNKKHKKFDFSIIGGPHYNSDIKFGLGLVAAGLYRTCPTDTLLPPSNVSLFSDVSTVGFYLLGIRGTNIFPQDKSRLKYTIYFFSFPSGFWGIGYDSCDNDDNGSEMKRWQARIKASYAVRLSKNLYLGPIVAYAYIHSSRVTRPELLNGQDASIWNLGLGVQLMYDSRDVLTNPHRGYYLNVEQSFRPKFLGNKYTFATTEIETSVYARPWRGAVLAYDFRTMLNFGNPSWAMMALFGSSNSMRGYYEGRYRDKHKFETQLELRQHVWKRNGVVVWGGFGTVFSKFEQLQFRRLLPNWGFGYRWEFKKNVNVRLDYGFGKPGQRGFIFNINEAF